MGEPRRKAPCTECRGGLGILKVAARGRLPIGKAEGAREVALSDGLPAALLDGRLEALQLLWCPVEGEMAEALGGALASGACHGCCVQGRACGRLWWE